MISVENEIHAELSRSFLYKFVEGVVVSLTNTSFIEFDVLNPTDEKISFVYDLCFGALARIEDHGGFVCEDQRYVSHIMFSKELRDPDKIIASWDRSHLHGALDDAIILQVFSAVASTRNPRTHDSDKNLLTP